MLPSALNGTVSKRETHIWKKNPNKYQFPNKDESKRALNTHTHTYYDCVALCKGKDKKDI